MSQEEVAGPSWKKRMYIFLKFINRLLNSTKQFSDISTEGGIQMKTISCSKNQLGRSSIKGSLYCMNMLTVLVPKYDEFSVCGEHMAKKL
jgi:hypothetical protein